MQETVSRSNPRSPSRKDASAFLSTIRRAAPSPVECGLALASALLLIFAFPTFDLWFLAWVAIVPLLIAVGKHPKPWPAFFTGWLFGSVFFYGSCYWLTYSIINFGQVPTWLAFPILVPGALVLGLFPALFMMFLARVVGRWGSRALFLAPLAWVALEWARLQCTGQLWNAIGYSQAYHPSLITPARWGGVYAVGLFLITANAALAFALINRSLRASLIAAASFSLVALIIITEAQPWTTDGVVAGQGEATVVAIQPNVPMDLVKTPDQLRSLTDSHFSASEIALRSLPQDGKPRLVIWPESPMNFTYGTDQVLRARVAKFAAEHHASLLLNSQEVAPNDGIYNSALLINEQGGVVAQYDKIRLLPFGEYVPLPDWMPGAGLITSIVGSFTAGTNFPLMQVGPVRTGVFICIESAYPHIPRRFTHEGADVLINISNDGYLGPTAVMRQHLANAVFRAVENGRPILRVTNTGISAFITSEGEVRDATPAFQTAVRIWEINQAGSRQTIYVSYGDFFVISCAILSLGIFIFSFWRRKN